MMSGDELRARILAQVEATPSPTRTQGKRRFLVMLAVSVIFALGFFAFIGGPAPESSRPRLLSWLLTGGWAVFSAALGVFVFMRPRGTALGRRPGLMLAAVLVAPAAMFLWLQVFDGTYVEPYVRFGWRCMGYTLAMGVLPLAAMLLARRGSEPRAPSALGAALGAVSGAAGGILVDLWCPLTNAPHALMGHVVPLLMLTALGALAGRWLLGVSAKRS